jgi:hypothetical protein
MWPREGAMDDEGFDDVDLELNNDDEPCRILMFLVLPSYTTRRCYRPRPRPRRHRATPRRPSRLDFDHLVWHVLPKHSLTLTIMSELGVGGTRYQDKKIIRNYTPTLLEK